MTILAFKVIINMDLSELERHLLVQSADVGITKRRMVLVGVAAAGAAIALMFAMRAGISAEAVGWLAIAYIGITAWEKISYGLAVIGYKSLIQKLVRRVEDLEREKREHGPATEAP